MTSFDDTSKQIAEIKREVEDLRRTKRIFLDTVEDVFNNCMNKCERRTTEGCSGKCHIYVNVLILKEKLR